MSKECINFYKQCRQIAGIVQENAAPLLLVSVRQLSDYETGNAKVPDDVVDRMATIYNAPMLALWHIKNSSDLNKKWLPEIFPTESNSDVWLQTRLANDDCTKAEQSIMNALADGNITIDDVDHIDAFLHYTQAFIGKGLSAKAYIMRVRNELAAQIDAQKSA